MPPGLRPQLSNANAYADLRDAFDIADASVYADVYAYGDANDTHRVYYALANAVRDAHAYLNVHGDIHTLVYADSNTCGAGR